MPPRCSQYLGASAFMLASSLTAMTVSGWFRSTWAHGHSTATAPRISSSCQASVRALDWPSFERTTKWALLPSTHLSSASSAGPSPAITTHVISATAAHRILIWPPVDRYFLSEYILREPDRIR